MDQAVEQNGNRSPTPFADKMVVEATPDTQELELKIKEVEGGRADPVVIIELEDDEDEPSAMASNLREPIIRNGLEEELIDIDEKMSAKTEPSSEADSSNSYSGPDPMGLLTRSERCHDILIDDDDDNDCSDDESGTSGSHPMRRLTREERWQLWMKRWAWLLHEESDGDYAFCLYCNIIINVNKKIKFIKQHNLSLYHQERECNYLEFKNSEEQRCKEANTTEIKHELGSNSYVRSMKAYRSEEVRSLTNFNWQKWLNAHPWLERLQPEGTIGHCKYCKSNFNVEFLYLRKRHETTNKHREAELTKATELSRRVHNNSGLDEHYNSASESVDVENADTDTSSDDLSNPMEHTPRLGEWGELIHDTSPQQCRCKLCDCKMVVGSFRRHLKTKMHASNLSAHTKKQYRPPARGIWQQYAELHPWMVADPLDPELAYCSVCEKRFMYGSSEIKRKQHENSANHLLAVSLAHRQESVENGEPPANDAGPPEVENQVANNKDVHNNNNNEQHSDEDSNSDQDNDNRVDMNDNDDNSTKSSVKATFKRLKTIKAKSIAAEMRKYPWMTYYSNRKIVVCKLCRVRLMITSSKIRHERSATHQRAIKEYKARQLAVLRKKQDGQNVKRAIDKRPERPELKPAAVQTSVERSPVVQKPPPNTMRGKVLVWKDRFPWLSYKRSETRTNYGWCKLCEISVFLPSFKFATKHQRSTRHIRLRLERKRLANEKNQSTPLASGEAKVKAAIAALQVKYDWLEPDAIDENHCHCKLCETRLPIKIFYLRQHDDSRKHKEQLELRKQKQQKRQLESPSNAVLEPEGGVEMEQDSDEMQSVKSLTTEGDESQPKRPRRSLDVRRILRALRHSVGKKHEERSQLDLAKDMITSSFDIVSRLRTMERETQEANASFEHSVQPTPTNALNLQRDTIDLFFDSITQTVKTLPLDLAAEGKAKIMQIICDLEVRAIRRTQEPQRDANIERSVSIVAENQSSASSSQLNKVPEERLVLETTANSASELIDRVSPTSSISSSVTIDSGEDEQPSVTSQNSANNDYNENNRNAETPQLRRNSGIIVNPSTPISNGTPNGTASRTNNKQMTFVHNFPSSTQQNSLRKEADTLRCVPLNKLTGNSQHGNNPMHSNSLKRPQNQVTSSNNVSALLSSPQPPLAIVHPDNVVNGNSINVIRKFRLSNPLPSNSTKYIAVQKPTAQSQSGQSRPQQQQQQQLHIVRAGTAASANTIMTNPQLQQQPPMRSQLNRPVIRQVTPDNRSMQP